MKNIEITVKINGVETPLHRISEQTLLIIRENSKSKEVPVVRIADFYGYKRLILRVPVGIGRYEGRVVAIDPKSGIIKDSWSLDEDDKWWGTEYYKNIRVIS